MDTTFRHNINIGQKVFIPSYGGRTVGIVFAITFDLYGGVSYHVSMYDKNEAVMKRHVLMEHEIEVYK